MYKATWLMVLQKNFMSRFASRVLILFSRWQLRIGEVRGDLKYFMMCLDEKPLTSEFGNELYAPPWVVKTDFSISFFSFAF